MNTILTDIIPAKWRKYVYAVLALIALVWSVYQASDGDWKQFVGGLIVVLVGATATSNTDVPVSGNDDHDDYDVDEDEEPDDDYPEQGQPRW